jgi:ABC-type glycerol-3-phosphate transport system permease component
MRVKPSRVVLYLVLVLVIIFYAAPIFIVISTSLKTDTQAMTKEFEWIPRPLIFDQYKIVLDRFPFERWILNSIIVTAGTVLLVLGVSLPAGYAFARLDFKGKNFLFGLSLLTIMLPFFAYIPQLYLMFYYIKLINTYVALIIPLATSGVSIFLFRQFISQIPSELDDAARIDGCNNWQIFSKIIMPLTKPAMVSVIIFTAIKSWNSLMWPLIVASKDTVKTLPVGLAVNVFAATTGVVRPNPYGVIMAAALISIVLPVVLFLILQRYFVQGIATTGLK